MSKGTLITKSSITTSAHSLQQDYSIFISKLAKYSHHNRNDLSIIDKITKSRNHDDDRTINDTGYEYNNNNGDNIHKYNNSQMVSQLCTTLQKQSLLFDQCVQQAQKMMAILYEKTKQSYTKIDQLLSLVQQKNNKIQQQKWNITKQQKQLQQLHKYNATLMQQIQVHKITNQSILKQLDIQRTKIKEKQQQQYNNKYKNLDIITEIKSQNQNISKQMRETYNEKNQLELQVLEMMNKLEEKNKEIVRVQVKLDWEIKRKAKIEEQLISKQQRIRQLQIQIQSLRQNLKNPYGNLGFDLQMFSPPEDQFQELQNFQKETNSNKVKLSEDVQNNSLQNKLQYQLKLMQHKKSQQNINVTINMNKSELNVLQVPKSNSVIPVALPAPTNASNNTLAKPSNILTSGLTQLNMSRTPSSNSPSKNMKMKKPLDPYYCHYVLLTQTIKVNENEQDFFNIDAKPFYKDIINEKIPMFQWSQWILEKFRQITNKTYGKTKNSNDSRKSSKQQRNSREQGNNKCL